MITSIKGQGGCWSSWAFGCVATAESVLIMNGWEENTIDLSEQYMLECLATSSTWCSSRASVWTVMNRALGGIPREAQYPYSPYDSHPGICTEEERVHIADKFMYYESIRDEEIIELLQTGPLTIWIST